MKAAQENPDGSAPSLAAALERVLGRPASGEEIEESRLRLRMLSETLRTIAARMERENP